jgi:hypothetical protein
MPIAEVEAMDGHELEEWRAYFARIPFTCDLIDHAAAQIAQAIIATMGGKKIRLDKLLLIRRTRRQQTQEEMAEAIVSALGG